MGKIYLFKENGNILGAYDSFLKFKKDIFFYIIEAYLEKEKFETKLDAGKSLKETFSKFFGGDLEKITLDETEWSFQEFFSNVEISKENKKKKLFSTLDKPIPLVPLSPLYGK